MEKLKLSELTIDSREVAQMVGKEHSKLLRDIRTYEKYLAEAKIGLGDFFKENIYFDNNNQQRPCYEVTKKGCELIAHKLTGKKGVLFTASYINRFHEMEEELKNPKPKQSWFIRNFNGEKIIVERDFIDITGIDIQKYKLFCYLKPGLDYNGWGWKCDNEEFKAKYGFDYGTNNCMSYFYICGMIKALDILSQDKKIKMNEGAEKLLLAGINEVRFPKRKQSIEQKPIAVIKTKKCDTPIQINIMLGEKERSFAI